MSRIMGRVQFYAQDKNNIRRIFSFKVHSKADAINALIRMNIQAGFYKPNQAVHYSEKIENPYFSKVKNPNIFDKIDKFFK